MKKLLTVLCIVCLAALFCPAALATAPSITVEDESLTVKYSNPDAQGSFTYVLLDQRGNIVQVEIEAGETWTPSGIEDGYYVVQAYYKDAEGITRSEESELSEVRINSKKGPIGWGDFFDSNDPLPSSFTKPVEYNDPTPAPDPTPSPAAQQEPQPVAPLYTLPATQPTAVPVPVATAVVSYAGTSPCSLHVGIRIRISDNDTHAASKGRSGPGTDMPAVATLNVGEVFQVLDCRILDQGGVHWFLINKNGINCWVASGRCERY